MTKETFLKNFYCLAEVETNDVSTDVTTAVKSRATEEIVAGFKTTIDTFKSDLWIADMKPVQSETVDRSGLIELAKRAHLNLLVLEVPIDDYHPTDTEENPDVSDMYK